MQRPRLALVGDSVNSNEVAAFAKRLGIKVDKYNYIKDLKQGYTGQEFGVMYVMPMQRGEILSLHRNLKKDSRFSEAPCFAVTPDWVSSSRERKMYGEGIRMIFEWPKDKGTFSDLLTALATVGAKKVKNKNEDKSLETAIGNRLKLKFGQAASHVGLPCYNGIAMLDGWVPSIRLKKQVIKAVKNTPGVRGVVAVSLKVKVDVATDRALKLRARKALGTIDELGKNETIRVEVRDGKLIVYGNIPSKNLHRQILEVAESVDGIRDIEDFLIVSKAHFSKDRGVAQRATRIMKKASLSGSKDIRVKVVNGMASLQGVVGHPMDKEHLESVLKTLVGVRRIDNKLIVNAK